MANVSSSNGLEKRPKLRFPGFDEPYKLCRIGDIYAERSERNAAITELLSVTINDGVVPRAEIEGKDNSSEDKSNYKVVRKGDMVYNSMRMWQGANGISDYDGIVSPAYTVLQAKFPISNGYFAAFFKTGKLINEFRKNSQGMTSDTWNLKYPQIETIKIYVPQLSEQEKIAALFAKLNERIEKQRQLVEALKKYKRGLLNALIEGNLHIETSFARTSKRLGDIFAERCNRAKGEEELLAVTIKFGVQKRTEIDLKDNSSDDKGNYKSVKVGDIAYNTMRMWQGASGVSQYDGIVSPAYTVVYPIDPTKTNSLFFGYYFKYQPLVNMFQKFSQGLTSDTWNLKYPQFAEIKVVYPSKEEQDKIVEILTCIDTKLKNETSKLDHIQSIKNGLLQRLFI